jgi:5-oxoprolinase (ATP-hydrolysing)
MNGMLPTMSDFDWQFFIDVGGTFTDVVARRPDGEMVTFKLLSSGAIRGVVGEGSTPECIVDERRTEDSDGIWAGYGFTLLGSTKVQADTAEPGRPATRRVTGFDAKAGRLDLDQALSHPPAIGTSYELRSNEEAPVTAIRYLMGQRLSDPLGPIQVRLGTTRATNALLERKGAQTALITTKGFGDVLKIGYQDRPELFKLNIRKRSELTSEVVEIDERIAPTGEILKAPNQDTVVRQLMDLANGGIESLAICLLHAHVNPVHEEFVASLAEAIGLKQVSLSSRVSRLERIVPRGDTTVLDAYLSPVIKQYVQSIRQSIPRARFLLMTSAGGLMDCSTASGKDTILSGPAGGVVGCAFIARENRHSSDIPAERKEAWDAVIGFDMGGTSTDVSRVDLTEDGFEYQHETVKAGVRIMTPMLAVETVAAGGGSICSFDGHMLSVGPESAGADPGPACYGRGGPLTVTDMNVFLGRVPPDFFPFPLDKAATMRLLEATCKEVNIATDSALTSIELAEGFLQIANARMASAIKRISLAKGYDLRRHTLVSFGGAGGQHACAIARSLGIPRVLHSPFAGVLSALGIGVADVKHIAQRTVHVALDERTPTALEQTFTELDQEVASAMKREGIRPEQLSRPQHSLDLCYEGEASLITVPSGTYEQVREGFESMHRQLYGYVHQNRAVEVRVARSELTASAEPPAMKLTHEQREGALKARSTIQAVFEGKPRQVPVYLREDLRPADELAVPSIVIEPTSTVVIEPGWQARITEAGDLVLADQSGSEAKGAVSAAEDTRSAAPSDVSVECDPIQLELFNNQFVSVAEQMGTTLQRTSLSTNVKERLDFSCAIFTPEGNLVVNAPHIPVHLGGMSECIKALIEDVGHFEKGDIYITNDPYRGGSHLNDVTVITPVHDEAGERLLFFAANRAHHAEIGGSRPGSMPPDSASLAEEGVIIRAFRWMEHNRPRMEELRAILTAPPYPSRTPEENLADTAAQVAANQTGVRELNRMINRYGVDVVHAYMGHIQAAACRKMRAALKKVPDGIHKFTDYLDDGSPITLTVTIEGDRATLDFTGTGAVLDGNLNANRAIVTSAVLYCLRCLIDEDIPLNAGVLEPVEIVLPECLLNPPYNAEPSKCPAVAGGNVETSQRVVDCVFGALKMCAASQGTMNNLLLGNERFGYYETICGGAGAGPGFTGADAVHTNMTNTRMTDPELLEARCPVRLVRFAIRQGSGGAGRWWGGDGVIREIEFLEALEISIISQRRIVQPYGLEGGSPGHCGKNILHRLNEAQPTLLPPIVRVLVRPGDRLIMETPGGGGYGSTA